MRPVASLLLVLVAPVAQGQEVVKLFTDQGKTYLRSESAASLVPGTELPAFSDAAGTKSAGKAIVMEVTGQLARVSFDDDAAKGAAKYVRVVAHPAAPVPAALPPVVNAAPPPAPPAAGRPLLKATLGRGDGSITVRNDSGAALSACQLTFPDRRFAPVGDLAAGKSATIGYDKIKDAPDVGDDWLLVRCTEGEAELHVGQPSRSPTLVGHVEEGRKGGVFVFNDGANDWTGCDLIKPNGTHYFQGGLKAHSSDSIRGGLFKAPSGPEVITLTCAQGAVSQPVP